MVIEWVAILLAKRARWAFIRTVCFHMVSQWYWNFRSFGMENEDWTETTCFRQQGRLQTETNWRSLWVHILESLSRRLNLDVLNPSRHCYGWNMTSEDLNLPTPLLPITIIHALVLTLQPCRYPLLPLQENRKEILLGWGLLRLASIDTSALCQSQGLLWLWIPPQWQIWDLHQL